MFLALQYGIMYVLSFATIIAAVATALALVLGLVMIVGRSAWRHLRQGVDVGEATAKLLRHGLLCHLGPGHFPARAFPFGCLAQTNNSLA
jgi:hypothetical protein